MTPVNLRGPGSPPSASDEQPAPSAATLVGLLGEEARLRCLAAVVLGATSPREVADRAGLDLRAAVRALERLAAAGVVATGAGGLVVRAEPFRQAARRAARDRAELRPEDVGATPAQARVLRNFVTSDGRLASIPRSRSKRRMVLDFLAGRFEPGRVYPEPEVNAMLSAVHADHAALRRYLVDEGFLERRDGFYWRSGGTFEV